MGVPYTFANVAGGANIPLSELDTNFATPITLGTASVALGNSLSGSAVCTAIGAYPASNPSGYGSGTVTSVAGTGTVSGITLTGTVTSSGSLTLGGSLNLSSPPAIGGTTPNTGAFTSLTATSGIINANTANAALRITQIGAGNALLVEDSANPDSTPFVIDANGKTIIGYTASIPLLGVSPALQLFAADGYFSQSKFSNDAFAPWQMFTKSRNATVGSQTVVASGDDLGVTAYLGSDGTAFIRAAQIAAQVDGTPGTNDMPGRLVFSTTADGASTPTERMRIDNAGNVGFGTTPNTFGTIFFGKQVTGQTSGSAVYALSLGGSGVTSNLAGFTSRVTTSAAAYTLGALSHFSANPQTKGAGSTITSQNGFIAESSLTEATNNYGFFGNLASATGAWNFYAAGTANNYFAGTVGVGVSPVASNGILQLGSYASVQALLEKATITAAAPSATTNFDVVTQAVQYYTTNASANFTFNIRGNSTTTLNTIMQTGQSCTIALLVTNGATPYYPNVIQIDGSTVTPKWQGGTAPSAGNASAVDIYTFTIIKTGSAAYTVFGVQTKFA